MSNFPLLADALQDCVSADEFNDAEFERLLATQSGLTLFCVELIREVYENMVFGQEQQRARERGFVAWLPDEV